MDEHKKKKDFKKLINLKRKKKCVGLLLSQQL